VGFTNHFECVVARVERHLYRLEMSPCDWLRARAEEAVEAAGHCLILALSRVFLKVRML
jgi:hypothetical protein